MWRLTRGLGSLRSHLALRCCCLPDGVRGAAEGRWGGEGAGRQSSGEASPDVAKGCSHPAKEQRGTWQGRMSGAACVEPMEAPGRPGTREAAATAAGTATTRQDAASTAVGAATTMQAAAAAAARTAGAGCSVGRQQAVTRHVTPGSPILSATRVAIRMPDMLPVCFGSRKRKHNCHAVFSSLSPPLRLT